MVAMLPSLDLVMVARRTTRFRVPVEKEERTDVNHDSPPKSAAQSESDFERETAVEESGEGRWTTELSDRWNIGENPNGGYLMAVMLRALTSLCPGRDPLSVTAHFLRPGLTGVPTSIEGQIVKPGRVMSTVSGSLSQAGKTRVQMLAGIGHLGSSDVHDQRSATVARPEFAGPEECVGRGNVMQGVDVTLLERVEVRLVPELSIEEPQGSSTSAPAEMKGWIRFADGRSPDASSLPVFADAFPPALFTKFGAIGWVPTLEMTVQVRRQPVDGWIGAHFVCDDLKDGTLIESGSLWDEAGNLVARSRQLGLLIGNESGATA